MRNVADLSVRGPLSSSGSANASMRGTSPSALRGLVFGDLGLRGLLGEIGLADPAGLEARLHDHRLGVVAGNLDAVENARVLGRLAAVLALGPANEIVGGAAGEVLDRLDLVLAEPHQHL